MTIKTGKISASYVSSDHVGWQTCGFLVSVNVINQALIDAYFAGIPLVPIARVYVKEVATGIETQIPGVVTRISVRVNKDSRRGNFNFTVKPRKHGATFSNLFHTELDTTYLYTVTIKAGYVIDETEILVPVIKGHTLDRMPDFGSSSSALSINGSDFAEKLENGSGLLSGDLAGSALAAFKIVLNAAGLNLINSAEFTDFALPAGFVFTNNNGLEIIERLAAFRSTTWYFDGSGVFILKDLDNTTDPTADYTLPTNLMETFSPDRSRRRVLTRVNVVGNGVALSRQTDAADRAKYGENKFETIQNSLITTKAEAIEAADQMIFNSRKNRGSIRGRYFPYFYIGTVIQTSHQEIGVSRKYRLNGYTHTFEGESMRFQTSFPSERTDYTAPTIGTV